MAKLFESQRNDDIIEVRLYDGFFTNYQGRARVKNKKEVEQLKQDLEAKGVDVGSLFL